MSAVSGDFTCRGAPLEYWFVKLQAGDLSFLVDFIFRAGADAAEVRISLWVRRKGRVVRSGTVSGRARGTEVVIGESLFAANSSIGRAADVEWELSWEPGSVRIAPSIPVTGVLHPLDLELISYPRLSITGQVRVSQEVFPVRNAAGTMTHYWGRRLPDAWRWVSAAGPDGAGTAVEAVLMRTRLWGRAPAMAAGYLWTAGEKRQAGNLLVSPVSGLLNTAGPGTDFVLTGRSLRRTVRLSCRAAPEDFNDLGEGIRQTLQGTCTLAGDSPAMTGAGLEYRSLAWKLRENKTPRSWDRGVNGDSTHP